ncbi:MAG: indolepyruvate ferredoxin oxidoreductase subunit alpha [Fibrobacter sp.]|jgi:indolepyruvate ferredoxin oxidoreductase alpha subunit|nr:indolepyruvate ferredoxin oxidoreductase subunit alpha [Fibrobacter sp.]
MNQKEKTIQFLSGDEALGRGAYEAGLGVACAYPGTPSTEILEYLSKYSEVDSQWSVNEKVAFEVALGAAIGGVRSLYASKHVGLNVAMDPLMTASYTGINAGFVIVVCDDPGLHSSQNEQDTRWVSIYGKLPMIEPSSPSEAYRFIKEAFQISEQFDTPVLFRMTTRVAHSKEGVQIAVRTENEKKALPMDISKYVMVPGNAFKRHILVEKRMENLSKYAETTTLNSLETGNSGIGFLTSGVSYHYIKEMFPDASVLKLGFTYPFCDSKIREFSRDLKELYIVEELDPFIEEHVKTLGIPFKTKENSYRIGELQPQDIPRIVEGLPRTEVKSTARKPVLCRGCPHRFVFTILKRLKVTVAGDIGCYTLGATPPLSALHTCICMGAGITVHEGLRRAHPDQKIIGVIGDSTFIHSGITGLINAVYNNMKGLIIILDNSTTAMTGGQNHPGTGQTITGQKAPRLLLEEICKSCGVTNVDVLTPFKFKELESLIRQRLAEDALSVIIAREPCRLIERRRSPAPEYVQSKCKKCGLCLSIDCPGVVKTEDGYITIDQETCAGCNLCVEICSPKALRQHG